MSILIKVLALSLYNISCLWDFKHNDGEEHCTRAITLPAVLFELPVLNEDKVFLNGITWCLVQLSALEEGFLQTFPLKQVESVPTLQGLKVKKRRIGFLYLLKKFCGIPLSCNYTKVCFFLDFPCIRPLSLQKG